jgi:hypothetical protein
LNRGRRARVWTGVAGLRSAFLIAIVAGLAAGTAPVAADSIVYRCFPNLCRVAPDGSDRAQLTRDASSGGPVYAWLSATRDGSRLGVPFGNRAHVLDGTGRHVAGPLPHSGGAVLETQISPDGAQVATIETITETLAPYPGGIPTPHRVLGRHRDLLGGHRAARARRQLRAERRGPGGKTSVSKTLTVSVR